LFLNLTATLNLISITIHRQIASFVAIERRRRSDKVVA